MTEASSCVSEVSMDEAKSTGSNEVCATDLNEFAQRKHMLSTEPVAINYIIDEFWAESFVVFAGAHGLGKSTIVVFLALVACGAIQVKGLKVQIPRDILYLTEDKEQLNRLILETVAQWNGSLEIAMARLHVFQAKRIDARKYSLLQDLYKPLTRTVPHQATGKPITVEPILILDTANACLEVDGDKDNSAVGKTINALRILFKSVLLVTHVSKGTTRNDPELIDARGATAWVADAQTEWVLFEDKDVPYARFLFSDSPKKRRDAGFIRELKFETTRRSVSALDDFGFKHELRTVVVMSATYSDKSAREDTARREKAKEEQKRELDYKDFALKFVRKAQEDRLHDKDNPNCYPAKTAICDSAKSSGFPRDPMREMVDQLIESGEVVEKELPQDLIQGARKTYLDMPAEN